jgi:hypothetical protein
MTGVCVTLQPYEGVFTGVTGAVKRTLARAHAVARHGGICRPRPRGARELWRPRRRRTERGRRWQRAVVPGLGGRRGHPGERGAAAADPAVRGCDCNPDPAVEDEPGHRRHAARARGRHHRRGLDGQPGWPGIVAGWLGSSGGRGRRRGRFQRRPAAAAGPAAPPLRAPRPAFPQPLHPSSRADAAQSLPHRVGRGPPSRMAPPAAARAFAAVASPAPCVAPPAPARTPSPWRFVP